MTEANAGVAAINRIPAQFSIFKGQTAARFQLQKPEKEEDRFRTGCISSLAILKKCEMEIAFTIGKKRKSLLN